MSHCHHQPQERMYFDASQARVFESKCIEDREHGRIVFCCLGCDVPANLPLDGVATHACACGLLSTWDGGEHRFSWAQFTALEGNGYDLSAWDDAPRFESEADTP